MVPHAQHAHSRPDSSLRLAADLDDHESPDVFPRWLKVLAARDAVKAGRYDDPSVIESKLDACMDTLLADLTT